MDIDQLRLILDTLKGAGNGAFVLGIIFLIRNIAVALIVVPAFVYVVLRNARLIAETNKYNEEMLHRMRESNASGEMIVRRVCEASGADHYPYIDSRKAAMWLSEAEVALTEKQARK